MKFRSIHESQVKGEIDLKPSIITQNYNSAQNIPFWRSIFFLYIFQIYCQTYPRWTQLFWLQLQLISWSKTCHYTEFPPVHPAICLNILLFDHTTCPSIQYPTQKIYSTDVIFKLGLGFAWPIPSLLEIGFSLESQILEWIFINRRLTSYISWLFWVIPSVDALV